MKIETFVVEQRGEGRFLVGRWPQMTAFAPDVIPLLLGDGKDLRLGDDFMIRLDNASAHYRYVEHRDGNLVCTLIKSTRAVAS